MGDKGRKAAFDIYERGGVNVLALLSGGQFLDLRVVGDRPRTLLDQRVVIGMCLIQIDKLRMGVIDDEVEAEGLQEYLFGKEDASLALFDLLSCRKFR